MDGYKVLLTLLVIKDEGHIPVERKHVLVWSQRLPRFVGVLIHPVWHPHGSPGKVENEVVDCYLLNALINLLKTSSY